MRKLQKLLTVTRAILIASAFVVSSTSHAGLCSWLKEAMNSTEWEYGNNYNWRTKKIYTPVPGRPGSNVVRVVEKYLNGQWVETERENQGYRRLGPNE